MYSNFDAILSTILLDVYRQIKIRILSTATHKRVNKKAKAKVKSEFTWAKIAQDTHFTYQKAICQTMAERQANQIAQEKAAKVKRTKGEEKEIRAKLVADCSGIPSVARTKLSDSSVVDNHKLTERDILFVVLYYF